MESKQIMLHFPLTGGGPDQGPNDSGLEHFLGNVPKHIARECAQNSIDAAKRANSPRKVRLEFTLHQIAVNKLPGLHELKKSVIPACREYYSRDPKAKRYCETALKVLAGETVPVLRISDYETTGLNGSDNDRNGQWYSLVKSSGVSSKDVGSAGSFGIGKHAPFAASAVRTVYYTTRTDNSNVAFQGVSKWWSHENHDKKVTQGTGFIGLFDRKTEACHAIREAGDIPSVFSRTEPGTDIWVPGFTAEEGWEDEIIKHLLTNFWLAIFKGDIEFQVNGQRLSRENLKALLEKYSTHYDFTAHHYFLALTSEDSVVARETFPFIGEMRLYLLASDDEQLPKNVQGMRKTGMVIIEKKRFNCRRHYAGVLLCQNEEGNSFLRSIEPPRHDDWERERITERGGKRALDSMWNWVRKNVQELNPKPTSEAVDVPNLSRYLPDFPDKDTKQKEGEPGLESKPSSGDIPVTETPGTPPKAADKGGGDEPGEGVKGKKQTGSGGDGGGGGGGKWPGPVVVKPVRLRAIRMSNRKYRVIARSETTERGSLLLQVVNDDGSLDPADLTAVTRDGQTAELEKNIIKGVELSAGKPAVFEIELGSAIPVTLSGTIRLEQIP